MDLLSFIKDIFKPAADIIDEVHTSKEEKLQLRNELATIETTLSSKLIELESKLLESQSKIITAEAQGESWLQRNWRPCLMVWFSGLIGCFWFGLTPTGLSEELISKLFDIVQLGIGGYIGGRTVEKITKTIKG